MQRELSIGGALVSPLPPYRCDYPGLLVGGHAVTALRLLPLDLASGPDSPGSVCNPF